MIDRATARRLTIALAATAAVVLTAMVAITFATGVAQEPFERQRVDYLAAIADAAPTLRAIIGLDALFLIAYTGFFVLLPRALGVDDEPIVRLGVRTLIAVAVLDIVEDHHLLAIADAVRDGLPVESVRLALQQVLSQAKFHLSYLGLALVALGLPRRTRGEHAFAWMLGLPLPVLGAVQWAVPSLEGTLDVARWLAFMSGFAAAIVTVRAAGSGRVDAAAATGAPA